MKQTSGHNPHKRKLFVTFIIVPLVLLIGLGFSAFASDPSLAASADGAVDVDLDGFNLKESYDGIEPDTAFQSSMWQADGWERAHFSSPDMNTPTIVPPTPTNTSTPLNPPTPTPTDTPTPIPPTPTSTPTDTPTPIPPTPTPTPTDTPTPIPPTPTPTDTPTPIPPTPTPTPTDTPTPIPPTPTPTDTPTPIPPTPTFTPVPPTPTFTPVPPTPTFTPVPPTPTPTNTPTPLEVCHQLIDMTDQNLTNAAITGKNAAKDRAKLERKLDEAVEKLDIGAYESAIGKLKGFRGKIIELAYDGNISGADANQLVADADAAINCISGLIGP